MGAFALGCQAAWADPTTLICQADQSLAERSLTIELDQAKGTVTTIAPANAYSQRTPTTYVARLEPKTISFSSTNGTQYGDWSIDRMTGVVTARFSDGMPYEAQTDPNNKLFITYRCSVGKVQF